MLKIKEMKPEDKELLLKDLSARLPYGVICKTSKGSGHLCTINQTIFGIEYGINIKATERDYFNDREEIIKPYLRPMSSMTEEEKKEYIEYAGYEIEESVNGKHYEYYLKDFCGTPDNPSVNANGVDWLNKNMFDFRGLIPAGAAIEINEENNPYK